MPSLLQEKEQEKQQEKEKEVEVHVGREREREAGLGFPAWRSQIPIPVQTAALKLVQGRLIRSSYGLCAALRNFTQSHNFSINSILSCCGRPVARLNGR